MKNQLATLTEDGAGRLQKCGNQEEQGKIGRNWQKFPNVVCVCGRGGGGVGRTRENK